MPLPPLSFFKSKRHVHLFMRRKIHRVKISPLSLFKKRRHIRHLLLAEKRYLRQMSASASTPTSAQRSPKILTPSKKRALLIGINYTGTSHALQGCLNDVEHMKTFLNSKGFVCTTITDHKTSRHKPTRKTILQAFAKFLKTAQDGDTLFFHYSGHGSYIKDVDNNEWTGYDDVIVCSDNKYVVDDELRNLIDRHLSPKAQLWALMDCCYSGTGMDLRYSYKHKPDDTYDVGDFTHSKITDTKSKVYLISGCSDLQTSSDAYINGMFRGAMTWSFLETMKTISPSPLSLQICLKNMREKLAQNNYEQIPQLSCGQETDIKTATVGGEDF